MLHKWYAKWPPIYIFLGDIWIREQDNKEFLMTRNSFKSDDRKTVTYTSKTKILRCGDDSPNPCQN
jgi:hypothetical protein